MKFMRAMLFSMAVLFSASSVYAQGFLVQWFNFAQPIDSICGGSTRPVADGTIVQIMWDLDPAGIGPEDRLVTLCDNPPICDTGPPNTFNFQTFPVNGFEIGGEPGRGYFYSEDFFVSVGGMPTPNRFYLRICLPTRHWVSEVVSPVQGPQEIYLSNWVCNNAPCPGCLPPEPPTAVNASDNVHCNGVQVTWNYRGDQTNVNRIIIYRDGGRIASVDTTVHVYTDTTAVAGTTYAYGVSARRVCAGPDSAFSAIITNPGTRAYSPPTPTGMTATDTQCDSVGVTWTYNTNAGVDSFRIKRGGVRVGAILVTGSPGTRTFQHRTTDGTTASYSVVGWSAACGEGTAASDPGTALQRAAAPANVQATDGLCDSTVISWTAVAGAAQYRIRRDGVILQTINAPLTSFRDVTGTLGQVYAYTVATIGATCGEGSQSPPDNGHRIGAPTATPTGVFASNNQNCDSVTIRWTDIAGETGYKIIRQGATIDTIGTTAADVVVFRDTTAVPGTLYSYRIRAFNACGNGALASSSVTGQRRAVPAQVTGVTASTNFCDRVSVAWNTLTNTDSFEVRRDGNRIGAVVSPTLSFQDMTAAQGVVYNYTVVAKNPCGLGTPSAQAAGSRRNIPAVVQGVGAGENSCTQVVVTWTPQANTDSFVVNRDGSRIGAVLGSIQSFADLTATPGVTYGYAVIGKNACGEAAISAPDSGRRMARPAQVTGLQASDTSNAAIYLIWNDLPNDELGYRIVRDGAFLAAVAQDVTSYRDTTAGGALLDFIRNYRVHAVNICGNGDSSVTVQGILRTGPPAVTGLAASTDSCDAVYLRWNDLAAEDSFQVRRNGVRIAVTLPNVTTYVDVTAVPGTTYNYTVVGYVLGLEGGSPTPVPGRRKAIPAVVTALNSASDRCDMVYLGWQQVNDRDSVVVYRDGNRIGAVPNVVTEFQDITATPGVLHEYWAVAKNSCGSADTSAHIFARRLIAPTTPANLIAGANLCTGIQLSWTASAGDFAYYRIKRNGDSLATTTNTTFTDTTAAIGQHTYTVAAVSSRPTCGTSAESTPAQGTRLQAAGVPQSVSASENRCDSVIVTWNAATGDVDGYLVYENATLIDSLGSGLTRYAYVPGVGTYNYTVRAYSAECGPGTLSAADGGARLPLPTTVTNLTASVNRCDGVNLTWTAGTGTISGYIVQRGGVPIATLGAGVTQYFDNTAPLNNSQYDVITSSVLCGNSAPATVTGTRLLAPQPPTNLAATTNLCDSVIVTWTAAAGTYDSCRVYRNGVLRATLPGAATRFGEAPVSGTTYRYTVGVFDDVCGTSDTTAGVNGLRQADAGIPTNLAAINTCEGIALTWTASTGVPVGYRVYRNDTLIVTIPAPQNTYTDTSVPRGVSFTYNVSAYTLGCGETADSNPAVGMRLPLLTQVTDLSASSTNCNGIALNWTALVGTTIYKVYRNSILFDSTAANTYTDVSMAPGVGHSYTVAAQNICGVGAQSAPAAGVRYNVPVQVTGLTASDTSCAVVQLTWTDVPTETRYLIYRNSVLIDSVAANVLTYTDGGATPGTHSYTVRARNECGLGAVSAARSGTRIPGVAIVVLTSATVLNCNNICVTWQDLPNETGYKIYRNGVLVGQVGANVTTFCDTGAAPGTYAYTVAALNVCGDGQMSLPLNGTRVTVPLQVQSLTATTDSCASITLTWADVATEDYYRIYRDGVAIDSTPGPNILTYRNAPVAPGSSFNYSVMAVNYCGNGPLAAAANGRTAAVPTVVQNVAATITHCQTITVTWADLADELSYEIYRDGAPAPIAVLPANMLSYVDNPTIGTHTYIVRGVNICGRSNPSAMAIGERQGPPTGTPVITGPDSACTSVTFNWTAVTDILGYVIYRNGARIDSVGPGVVQYTDGGLAPATTYTYTVRGVNECGNGPLSAGRAVLFVPLPPQVSYVAASVDNCGIISVNWNNVANEHGYRIYRSGTVPPIATVGRNITWLIDAPPTHGTYQYRVEAFNVCGAAPLSAPATGIRRGPPARVSNVAASDTRCAEVQISWTDLPDEYGYIVLRNNIQIALLDVNVNSYIDAPGPGTYAYAVRAFNECDSGLVSLPDNGTQLTAPNQVLGLSATANRCDSIIVQWTDLSNETLYRLFHNGVAIADLPANRVRYAHAPTPGTHTYTVYGENLCGAGLPSAPATGVRIAFPGVASNVRASDTQCGQITVTWTSGGGDVDSFRVRRNGAVVASVAGNVLAYTNMISGSYGYSIVAVSTECGPAAASAVDSGRGWATPTMPANLRFVEPVICDTVRLMWTASTGDVAGYEIRRDGEIIDTVTVPGYRDSRLPDQQQHAYTVTALGRYCPPANPAGPVIGSVMPLVQPTAELPDTLYSGAWLVVGFNYCAPVDSMDFLLSLDGLRFEYLGTLYGRPPVDSVFIPPVRSMVSNCVVRILAYRGSIRRDTLDSNPFWLDVPLSGGDALNPELPREFTLDQNYPNPFNPSTTIRFGVPQTAEVTIDIFDMLGRHMTTLVSGTVEPGWHTIVWNCASCPTGMYLMRMQAAETVKLRKMLLMK